MNPAVAPFSPEDEPDVEALLDAAFAGRHQARLGEVIDVLALPGFVSRDGSRIVGVAMYRVEGDTAELAAFVVADHQRHAGIGTALVHAVVDATTAAGARRLWLVTMNDNVDALRFYQRRGFHLAELHAGAADAARNLKPSIPLIGDHRRRRSCWSQAGCGCRRAPLEVLEIGATRG